MGLCVLCEAKTSGSLEFCRKCYNDWKDDIKNKKAWIRVVKNDEQRERRRREKEFDNASLDQIIDRTYERERY